jgi:hypothetical protein
MESPPDRSRASDEGRVPTKRPAGGKLERIAGHTQGLVEDLREWIDLRLDLAVLELEERVDTVQNQIALGVTMAILAFFAGLFGLTTAALGLGWLLGHPFWGFGIVFLGLVLFIGILRAAKPELVPRPGLFEKLRGSEPEPDASPDNAVNS